METVHIKPRLWTNRAGDHQMPLRVTKSSVPILTARARLLGETLRTARD